MDAQLEQDKQLIGLLQAYTINPDCVPVELVRQLKRIERSINSISKPLFVDDFFLEGWGSEKDEE